jgi:hypothetical protein
VLSNKQLKKEGNMYTVRCPLQSGDEGAMLLSYLDRQLPPDSLEAFDRHVAVCPDCARVVDGQRAVWRALDQWEPIAVSADFDDRVMARIAEIERPWWGRMLDAATSAWWKPAMPLAAACLALLAVAVWNEPSPAVRPVMDSAEVQQVEDALSDLEMLRQLGLTETAAASASQPGQSL